MICDYVYVVIGPRILLVKDFRGENNHFIFNIFIEPLVSIISLIYPLIELNKIKITDY